MHSSILFSIDTKTCLRKAESLPISDPSKLRKQSESLKMLLVLGVPPSSGEIACKKSVKTDSSVNFAKR